MLLKDVPAIECSRPRPAIEMIYPIGHTSLPVRFERTKDGVVVVDGVPVTAEDGAISVQMPPEVSARGGPASVTLRIRADRTHGGRWLLSTESLATPERFYESLFELMASAERAWLPALGVALDAEIQRRLRAARGG